MVVGSGRKVFVNWFLVGFLYRIVNLCRYNLDITTLATNSICGKYENSPTKCEYYTVNTNNLILRSLDRNLILYNPLIDYRRY